MPLNTVTQRPKLDTRLQAFISSEAIERLRVTAAIRHVTLGEVLNGLIMKHLAAVPKAK